MSNVKSIAHNIIEDGHIQRTLFRALMIALVVLSTTYLYIISSITFNVLARKSLDTNVRSLQSALNQSELTYMNDLNKIDKNYALSNGFVEAHQGIFVTRQSAPVAIR
jgi:hypothetical protein